MASNLIATNGDCITVLRDAHITPRPWRNGGGVTREQKQQHCARAYTDDARGYFDSRAYRTFVRPA